MGQLRHNSADALDAAYAEQRRVDPFGHRLHALLGALWCCLACGPVSVVELGIIPVFLAFAIRWPRHVAVDARGLFQPGVLVAWAWIIWLGVTVSWSTGRTLGIEEVMACRFATSMVFLLPVLDRRRWLIGGLIAGLFLANGAQIVHAIGVYADIPSLQFPRMPHRNSGWWQPVVGGTILTAGLGLHLPAMLTGRGWSRLLGIIGVIASWAAVLATGSRGAWLASGGLTVIALGWGASRAPWRKFALGHLPVLLAAMLCVGLLGYRSLWPTIQSRGEAGVEEVRLALNDHDYSTDTGARILMAQVAWDAFTSNPVRGIGAGGFRTWGAARLRDAGRLADSRLLHNHAHDTFLQIAATTGGVGLVLFGGTVGLALWGGLGLRRRRKADHAPSHAVEAGPATPALMSALRTDVARRRLSGYDAGPGFALLGMLLVGTFDVIHINAQTSAVLWIVLTLCLRNRPHDADASAEAAPDASSAGVPPDAAQTTVSV